METIGKYQVQKVLGRGGMGTVYEAVDPFINRKIALKTMIPGLVDTPDLKARFLREAQAAGGLRHRNIVTVYDLGEDKGQPYIAMEFIEGTDLERVIQNREPLTVEWKLDILRQICEGLSYAHKSGIVHRDIKPANIRVTNEGEVKIMDFGIAHLQSSTMTKSGLVLGTVHYMAPEQIEGQKVDHRADIFSVGAIAYELIAYKRPFEGETITAVMYKIMHDRPDPKALPETEYSPGLQNIIMKALARDVRERYQSLDDMHHDVVTLVREMPTRVGVRADPGAIRKAEEQERAQKAQRDIAQMRGDVQRARGEGQLQRALVICRRLLELVPNDKETVALARQIEDGIQDRQVEQLCQTAVSYVADGDMALAEKIMSKVQQLAPESPRYRQLKAYVAEESGRRAAEALTAKAKDHLAVGDLEAARAAAEQALAAHPSDAVAREIRDRVSDILARRSTAGSQRPAPAPPPSPARPAAGVPLAAPAPAASAAGPAGPDRQAVRPAASAAATATPLPATPAPPRAVATPAVPVSDAAAAEARRSEVEALTSAALTHYLQNNPSKARKAIDRALAIDPGNKKAREMLRIIGSLG